VTRRVASNRVDRRDDDENDDRGRRNARCNNRTTFFPFTGLFARLPSDTKQNQAHTTARRSTATRTMTSPLRDGHARCNAVSAPLDTNARHVLDECERRARSSSLSLSLLLSLSRSLVRSVSPSCRFLSSSLVARHGTARHGTLLPERGEVYAIITPPVEIALARGHSTTAVAHRLTHTARVDPPDVLPRLTSATPARCLARLPRLTSRRDSPHERSLSPTTATAVPTADGIPAPLLHARRDGDGNGGGDGGDDGHSIFGRRIAPAVATKHKRTPQPRAARARTDTSRHRRNRHAVLPPTAPYVSLPVTCCLYSRGPPRCLRARDKQRHQMAARTKRCVATIRSVRSYLGMYPLFPLAGKCSMRSIRLFSGIV